MEFWTLKFSKQAIKDSFLLQSHGLSEKAKFLIEILHTDPYTIPPSFEKLVGFQDVYSRRINIIHRLVYRVYNDEKIIEIISMFRHYRFR